MKYILLLLFFILLPFKSFTQQDEDYIVYKDLHFENNIRKIHGKNIFEVIPDRDYFYKKDIPSIYKKFDSPSVAIPSPGN